MELKTLDDFLGNKDQKFILKKWLNNFYSKNKKSNYCIIYGQSGCGKTNLVELLAKECNMDILSIVPSDIKSKDDINNFIKSLNITSLDGKKRKIILIEDIKEYYFAWKRQLIELATENLSNHPIIYTTDNLSDLYYQFTCSGLNYKGRGIKILYPLIFDVVKHLRKINEKMKFNLSDETIKDIARNSKSIRSAELSLYNVQINDMSKPVLTNYEKLDLIKKRKLDEPLDIIMVIYTFNAIRNYDKKSLYVMNRLAEFDWVLNKYKSVIDYSLIKEIDPFIVNNMKEPIDKIFLKKRFIKVKDYDKKITNKKENFSMEKLSKQDKEDFIEQKIEEKTKSDEKSSIDTWI